MSVSSGVTAGVNATAQQYNDLRTDAITQYRRFWFEVAGSLSVLDEQMVIAVPANMTITKIKHRVKSGSATLRVKKTDGTIIKSGISVGTSFANETSGFSNTSLSEGDELQLDLTGVSAADTLRVLIYATETI